MPQHFDYICLGAGSGGIASANRAAMHGANVLLIEARHLGGTCVNVGCVPKKVMWYGAQVSEMIHLFAGDYGFDTVMEKFDWNHLVNNRETYIKRIHGAYQSSLAENGVTLLNGSGRFVNNNTIEVNGKPMAALHDELNQFLQEAEQALKDGDIILLADLLEYELAPRAELEVAIVGQLQARIPARAE